MGNIITPIMKPVIAAAPPVTGIKTNLIGCWEFENNALDSHNSYDGTMTGIYSTNAKIGNYCADFTTGNHQFMAGYAIPSLTYTDPFSYSIWIYPVGSNSTYYPYCGNRLGGGGGNFWKTTTTRMEFYTTSSTYRRYINYTPTAGRWNHIVIVKDEFGYISYYADNNLISTAAQLPIGGTIGSLPFYVGSGGSTEYTNLYADQLAMWNKGLSTEEIAYINNSGNGRLYSQWEA